MTSVDQPVKVESKAFNRIISYPTVSQLWETTKGYYSNAKQQYNVVIFVENKVTDTVKWIAPKVEPVMKNETIQKISANVDSFADKQLANIEMAVGPVITKAVVPAISHAVTTVKEGGITGLVGEAAGMVKNVVGEAAVPVDHFLLNHTTLALPVNVVVNTSERIIDYVIPEKEAPVPPADQDKHEVGPVLRAGKLSKRVQREAFKKLKSLNFRSAESINSMHYVVDLIKYASENLDAGIKSANSMVGESVKIVSDKEKRKEVNDKLQHYTQEAVKSLYSAVDQLHTQFHASKASLTERGCKHLADTKIAYQNALQTARMHEPNFRAFTNEGLASRCLRSLQEANSIVSGYVAKRDQESIPVQLIAAVTMKIQNVIDTLTSPNMHKQIENRTGPDQDKEK